jgi:hypothetical protein
MRLDDSKTRIFFDMHLPSWPGKGIAECFDPERIADAFSRAGADSAILYAKCQYGNFYTKIDGESLHPGLGGTDLLEELALLLRERGIRSIAYYSVSWDERIADERPDWLTQSSSGARGAGPSARWRTLCINGEYADMVERHVAAIARKPVDGLWLDMTIIGDGNCYCPRCREAFRKRFGAEPPGLRDDPRMGDFLAFRYDLVESFYHRIRSAARSAAPELAFTNNYWGYPYSSTGMGSRAIGAASEADFVTGEAYSDWTGIRSTSFLPIFLRGVARGRPYEALIGRFINTWDYTKKPEAFLSYEAFAVFAQGATVTVDDQPYHDGRIDEALYDEDLARIFAELRGRAATVGGRPQRFAAIYHSQKTKDRSPDQSSFIRSVSGAFRLLRDLKLQVEFLFDESMDEEALEGFRLIVLPDVSELGPAEWEMLEAFAAKGGMLLLTGALGSSDGAEAAKRALGLTGGSDSPYTVSYLRFPEFSGRDLLVRGRYAQYSGGSGTGSAIVDPICETSPARFFHNNLPAPYRDSGLPGLVEAALGSGSIALFPQPIFSHYAKEPSRELREIVRALAFRHVGRPFVEIRAPLKIDFSIFEDGDVVYVHLLNPNAESSLCCGLMDTYDGGFERSYEYMEEIVPVSDLEILVRDRELASVEALRERSALEVAAAPEGISIRVARLKIWEILRIELKAGRAGQ